MLHVGEIRIGARARVGARSTLAPGADVGKDAEVAPGSLVVGVVPAGEFWAGSPAERRRQGPRTVVEAGAAEAGRWLGLYGAVAPLIAACPRCARCWRRGRVAGRARRRLPGRRGVAALPWLPLAALVGYAVLVVLISGWCGCSRSAWSAGHHPVRSAAGVRIWATLRVLDEARTWLFPLYSSALTPVWLRLLGARIGAGVEASTVLLIPKFTTSTTTRSSPTTP